MSNNKPTQQQQNILASAIAAHMQKPPLFDWARFIYQGQPVFIIGARESECKGDENYAVVRTCNYQQTLTVGRSMLSDDLVPMSKFIKDNPTAAARLAAWVARESSNPQELLLFSWLIPPVPDHKMPTDKQLSQEAWDLLGDFVQLPHEKQIKIVAAMVNELEN